MATRDTGGQSQSGKSRRGEEEDVAAAEVNPETAERAEQRGEDVDDLLDEIDSVLEENAEEFVRGYVQKGGQYAAPYAQSGSAWGFAEEADPDRAPPARCAGRAAPVRPQRCGAPLPSVPAAY